ncbi:hypothetical protein C7212DRAFT_348075 [Tuber magnatum]|uniref:Uncharacterized protein n=1 Tax=Tuber magnatum TaxID=42249 RepID=A0A317SER9_9PEZI|nr:hypothetical protein C7212DRAFT_348075 [Tuber magnatum]
MPPWTDADRSLLLITQYNKLRKTILSNGSGRGRNPALNNVNKMPAKRMHEELVRREDDLEDDEYRDEEGETIVVNGKRFKVEGISDDERVIKTERVDDEGVIRLDDDELSFLCLTPILGCFSFDLGLRLFGRAIFADGGGVVYTASICDTVIIMFNNYRNRGSLAFMGIGVSMMLLHHTILTWYKYPQLQAAPNPPSPVPSHSDPIRTQMPT